jgi:hypothetical protein
MVARVSDLRNHSANPRGLILSGHVCLFHKEAHSTLPTIDGGTLRTVLDVQDYLLHLSKAREQLPRWQNVRESLGATADVREFSRQVELALLLDRKLR